MAIVESRYGSSPSVAASAHETERHRAAARLASDKDESDKDEQASVCEPGAGGSA